MKKISCKFIKNDQTVRNIYKKAFKIYGKIHKI